MKKLMALILALVLCLSLGACGAESQENVAGVYWFESGFDDNADSLVLNDDYTYELGYEKGTYKVKGNKIHLHRANADDSTTTLVKQGDVYYLESSIAPLKNEYGQVITFSEDGRIDYTFTPRSVEIAAHNDGTFQYTSEEGIVSLGTYSLENGVLTFTSEDRIFYWVYNKNGLARGAYKKYTVSEIKEALLGKWERDYPTGDTTGYEFLEDGTAIGHTLSGDFPYTYEIMADGTIMLAGSNDDAIKLEYIFVCGKMTLRIDLDPYYELLLKK